MNYTEHFNALFLKMKEEVGAIMSSSSNRLWTVQQSYLIVSDYCEQIKAPESFDSQKTEIEFFKKIRPGFESELIFLGELYYILSSLPEGRGAAISFLKEQYLPIRRYYQQFHGMYAYWQLGRSDWDSQLFTKSGFEFPLTFIHPLPIGDLNSLPAGKAMARFRAYRELTDFLEKEIRKMKHKRENGTSLIKWTATKAALVELAYALKATGAINNGNASIRDIATHLEQTFQQDLSQFYRTFQEIRIRKNSRTTFLDRLKEKLERWMDNTDLNSMGEG